MLMCSECGAELEADAVYCGHCGRRLRARRASLTGMVLDGRFLIDERIASGGFATIYRARHLASGAQVALKVLHGELARDRNLAARFRREAAALAQLRDAHTVTMYEAGEAPDGTLYIVMELLTGASLCDVFREQGVLGWRRVVQIARGVCSSLSEAHARGIIHRDIKPGNIQLEQRAGQRDFAKVLDFGIAKVLDGSGIDDGWQLTRVGQAVGTIEYMSPEQLIGSDCDGRSDIYALGVVMYEMLTGRRPFADATGPTSLVTALMTQTPVKPSHIGVRIPLELERALLCCLEREPHLRFANIDELAATLEQIVDANPEVGMIARSPSPRAVPVATAPTLLQFDDEEVTAVDAKPPVAPAPADPMPVVKFTRKAPASSRVKEFFAQGSTVGPAPMSSQVWLLVLLARDVAVALAVATLL